MKFTIGYIEHDKEVFDRLLGQSLKNLKGQFEIISTSTDKFPAANYNYILENTKTPYLILTHQDMSFSSNLLERIEMTIEKLNNKFGVLGAVGVDNKVDYFWSSESEIFELDTLDACFIVIKSDTDVRFNEEDFGEYHLYVEDFCAQQKINKGEGIYTILINGSDGALTGNQIHAEDDNYLKHHSCTVEKRGFAWGQYGAFKDIFNDKWSPLKTT